jgi:hypothetical protein
MSCSRLQVCERERWARRPSPGSMEVKGAEEMTSRMTRRTSTGRASNGDDDDVADIMVYRLSDEAKT